jgi:hypothetical protein
LTTLEGTITGPATHSNQIVGKYKYQEQHLSD